MSECPECGREFIEKGYPAQDPEKLSYIHRTEPDPTGGRRVVEWCVKDGNDNPRLWIDAKLSFWGYSA